MCILFGNVIFQNFAKLRILENPPPPFLFLLRRTYSPRYGSELVYGEPYGVRGILSFAKQKYGWYAFVTDPPSFDHAPFVHSWNKLYSNHIVIYVDILQDLLYIMSATETIIICYTNLVLIIMWHPWQW